MYFTDRWPGFDSGLYAGLRLVEILSHTDKDIDELLEGITHYYSTEELKVHVEDEIKFSVIEKKFHEFEKAMDLNDYVEVEKIVIVLEELINKNGIRLICLPVLGNSFISWIFSSITISSSGSSILGSSSKLTGTFLFTKVISYFLSISLTSIILLSTISYPSLVVT